MLSAGDQASFGHTFSITRLTVIPTFLSRAYVPRYACTRLRVSSKLAFSIPRPLIFIPLNSRPFDSCRSVAPVSRAFSSLPPFPRPHPPYETEQHRGEFSKVILFEEIFRKLLFTLNSRGLLERLALIFAATKERKRLEYCVLIELAFEPNLRNVENLSRAD